MLSGVTLQAGIKFYIIILFVLVIINNNVYVTFSIQIYTKHIAKRKMIKNEMNFLYDEDIYDKRS